MRLPSASSPSRTTSQPAKKAAARPTTTKRSRRRLGAVRNSPRLPVAVLVTQIICGSYRRKRVQGAVRVARPTPPQNQPPPAPTPRGKVLWEAWGEPMREVSERFQTLAQDVFRVGAQSAARAELTPRDVPPDVGNGILELTMSLLTPLLSPQESPPLLADAAFNVLSRWTNLLDRISVSVRPVMQGVLKHIELTKDQVGDAIKRLRDVNTKKMDRGEIRATRLMEQAMATLRIVCYENRGDEAVKEAFGYFVDLFGQGPSVA